MFEGDGEGEGKTVDRREKSEGPAEVRFAVQFSNEQEFSTHQKSFRFGR